MRRSEQRQADKLARPPRPCANPDCDKLIPPSANGNQRFHDEQCRMEARGKRYRAKNPDYQQTYRYQMQPGDYEAMKAVQGGRCAICGADAPGGKGGRFATDTTDYQPTPIPSANGHSPTVLGRTQSMFSPVKAITAGAVIFALGGVLLIAQPFDQQSGGVPGAATEETSGEAVPFEGVMSYGSTKVSGVEETLTNGVVTNRGQIWTLSSAGLSDPRLQGTVSNMWNWDEFKTGQPYQIEVGGFRIENDGGAWQMRPVTAILFPDDEYSVWTGIFDGEGDYEGLTAIAEVAEKDGFTVRGVVIEGDIPPAPESMSTE